MSPSSSLPVLSSMRCMLAWELPDSGTSSRQPRTASHVWLVVVGIILFVFICGRTVFVDTYRIYTQTHAGGIIQNYRVSGLVRVSVGSCSPSCRNMSHSLSTL